MTLKYYRYFVQSATVAPATSNAGSTYQTLHFRVNTGGQYSAASPQGTTNLPATLTPQSYAGVDLLTDIFLVSPDSGTTWKRVPRTTGGTGAQAVPAYDASWDTVNPSTLPNQLTTQVTSLDFGTFTAASSPATSFWVLSDRVISSLSLELKDEGGDVPTDLSDRFTFGIGGHLDPYSPGTGSLTTTYSGSVVWNPSNLNTLATGFQENQLIRVTCSLGNFNAASILSTDYSLQINLIPNRTVIPWSDYYLWPQGSVEYSDLFTIPHVTDGSTASTLTVNPFAVKTNGAVVTRYSPITLSPGSTGSYALEVTASGSLVLVAIATPTPDNSIRLCTFTWTAGIISNYVQVAPIRPSAVVASQTTGTLYHFAEVSSTGELQNATGAGVTIGIWVSGDTVGTQGYGLLELGAAVAAGDRLSSDATGLGVPGFGGTVALSDGVAGDRIPVLMGIVEGAGGTVTSVGLSVGNTNLFTVSGSPVTGSGTLTLTPSAPSSPNTIYAPSPGSTSVPSWRLMAATDLPATIQALTGGSGNQVAYRDGATWSFSDSAPFGRSLWNLATARALTLLTDPPRCQLSRSSSSQVIPNATTTILTFETDIEDNVDFWSPGSPGNIVIPSTGIYLISVRVVSATGIAGFFMQVGLEVGGGTLWSHRSLDSNIISTTTQIKLSAGDTLSLNLFQNTGGNVSISNIRAYVTWLCN